MARQKARARARVGRQDGGGSRATRRAGTVAGGTKSNLVARTLTGAVDGVEVVAVGALQLTRDVLMSAVSGAASIGAEAVSATVTGARGVVSATSRMVGDIAGTAQGAFREALNNARQACRGTARVTLRRPALAAADGSETSGSARGGDESRSRQSARRRRAATREARTTEAA
jgi:hypothetical protein